MSVPALRQPKLKKEIRNKTTLPDVQYVILSLKPNKKLVVSADAYHGIITVGKKYRCVFCRADLELDSLCKEKHKTSPTHTETLGKNLHIEEYAENLIREISRVSSFCTICNVVIKNIHLMRHLESEVHGQELEKAAIRAESYKPK